jgi:hypothetical protein
MKWGQSCVFFDAKCEICAQRLCCLINNNEHKTVSATFENPFQQTVDYTLMSASADDPTVTTSHETRTHSYNPPARATVMGSTLPTNVLKELVTTSVGRKKTQGSHLY